jgi:hypothetical protein
MTGTVIKRATDQLEKQLKRKALGLLNKALPPSLPVIGGAANPFPSPADVMRTVNRLADGGLGQVSSTARAAAGRVAENLRNQMQGKPTKAAIQSMANLLKPDGQRSAAPTQLPVAAPAPIFGGLTLERAIQIFQESAGTARAFKSLWHIEIQERKTTEQTPRGIGSKLNLLAIDCTFDPVIANDDQSLVGAAVIDSISGTDRVQVSLTTYDDISGSIQKWFAAKHEQMAHTDGTYGLPSDYLMTMIIRHMDVDAVGNVGQRAVHRFLVRPSTMSIDLSRRAHDLEELQMRFVQFDTCMQA